YTKRRAWLLGALSEIPGLSCNEPEGAFYAFPSVRGVLKGDMKTSDDFSRRLLEEEQTVVTDGTGFGAEGYVRISYATSMEQLSEGVTRIKRFVEQLK
ncbi:MAG TPA: aminotransferase class I/II-fold pyridoxal phosphate-dependent enzyme, partial [Candidatus Polarisedimenticolaceae bacterium]|nr:aminotransferase class I/II-fold pyridoxal phosphate-dependent enzyme [Candidatus Polarisedimenticolaceae bacterium]